MKWTCFDFFSVFFPQAFGIHSVIFCSFFTAVQLPLEMKGNIIWQHVGRLEQLYIWSIPTNLQTTSAIFFKAVGKILLHLSFHSLLHWLIDVICYHKLHQYGSLNATELRCFNFWFLSCPERHGQNYANWSFSPQRKIWNF